MDKPAAHGQVNVPLVALKTMLEDVSECVGNAYVLFEEKRVEWSSDLWATALHEFSMAIAHEGMVLQDKPAAIVRLCADRAGFV